MRASNILQLASLSPVALGFVVPKDVTPEQLTPEQLDELVSRGVDAPDNPRLDIGKDGCFRVEMVNEREEFKGCEPNKFLEEDGTCAVHATENKCESFCETSLKWFYGKEVPFHNGRCAKGPCTLEDRMGAEVSKSKGWGLQIGHGAFTLGASFSYTEGSAIVSGVVRQKPEDLKDTCGYWTFIPYMIESCGITAKGHYSENAFTGRKCSDVVQKEECYAKVMESPDGSVAGHVAFVTTECDDYNDRLAFCKQDPIYLKIGVSFDGAVNYDWVQAHFDFDLNKPVLSTAKLWCEQGQWPEGPPRETTTSTTSTEASEPTESPDSDYPAPPVPAREGTTAECMAWHEVKSGDDCSLLEKEYDTSIDQLREWNTYIMEDCSNIWVDTAVCVGV